MRRSEPITWRFRRAPSARSRRWDGQKMNASIVVQNLLQTPEQFAAIPIRNNPDGSVIKVGDVPGPNWGRESYAVKPLFNGQPSAALAIRQAAGANALETAQNVRDKLKEMEKYFPPGLKITYPYDTTPFVRVAINEVVKTLFEAIILVFLVMLLFLGSFRATLIPTIAVPVVLLGTFGVLGLFGFSINMLTMFAMVLAIGLLVDDAIVVVENVERIMEEEGLPPKEATRKSMHEITSALIGIGLVLSAVFGPMAFFGGSTGVIYRQFSLTIISAMLLSVVVALILTPVLCASLLKEVRPNRKSKRTFTPLRFLVGLFNKGFNWIRDIYLMMVGVILRFKIAFLLCFIGIVFAFVHYFQQMPTAYLPNEDQGIVLSMVQLPTGSTMEQTDEILAEVQNYFLENEKEAIQSVLTLSGMSFARNGPEQRARVRQAERLGSQAAARPESRRRCGQGPWGGLCRFETPGPMRSRRLRWPSWARPKVLTFSCRIEAAWAIRLWCKRNGSCWVWRPRTSV